MISGEIENTRRPKESRDVKGGQQLRKSSERKKKSRRKKYSPPEAGSPLCEPWLGDTRSTNGKKPAFAGRSFSCDAYATRNEGTE